MRLAALALLAIALVACGGGISKEQADFACTYMRAGVNEGHGLVDPFAIAHEAMQKKFGMSPPDAAAALREAIEGYCPQYRSQLR